MPHVLIQATQLVVQRAEKRVLEQVFKGRLDGPRLAVQGTDFQTDTVLDTEVIRGAPDVGSVSVRLRGTLRPSRSGWHEGERLILYSRSNRFRQVPAAWHGFR